MRVIDSQVHIYDRNSARYPWADTAAQVVEHNRQAGVDMAPAVTDEDLIGLMDRAGVDGAVLVSFGGLYGFDNRYALSAAARHPERYAVVGRLDPASASLQADVDDFASRPGAVGVRVLGYMNFREPFLAGA